MRYQSFDSKNLFQAQDDSSYLNEILRNYCLVFFSCVSMSLNDSSRPSRFLIPYLSSLLTTFKLCVLTFYYKVMVVSMQCEALRIHGQTILVWMDYGSSYLEKPTRSTLWFTFGNVRHRMRQVIFRLYKQKYINIK